MTTVLSTILLTAPLAFVFGWLTAKAVFQRLAILKQHGSRPAQPNGQTLQRGDAAPKPPADALRNNLLNAVVDQLRTDLLTAERDADAAQEEIRLLKEAVAEREHRLTELKQQLRLAQTAPEESANTAPALQNAKIARDARALQTRALAAEQECARLRHCLVAAENRLDTAQRRFSKWRRHFSPLAKQFKRQRMIIGELREELRQRDKRREQEANAGNSPTHALPPAPPPVAPRQQPIRNPEDFDKQRDDLEELRGIGPALSRKLNDRGIVSFRQLADLSQQELLKLGSTVGVSKKMVKKHDWKNQARNKLGLPDETGTETTDNTKPAATA
jgi:predicted flap endonuclease-1-like 5' DNA nuclease